MCRSIKKLRNPEEPATPDEIQAAALQFVRKISGYPRPSTANSAVFYGAVKEITESAERLLDGLVSRPAPQPPHPEPQAVSQG
ncbi:MAG TPA: DUF2277 domain-containing protein [Actinomycetota bacterium]|jgi:hypothetical protein|nr:DUF2277 domain-containing protein [Actinomycetota bacterium]